MIDRVWRIWQLQNPDADSLPETLANEVMQPFSVTAANMLDVTTLGYDYATAATGVSTGRLTTEQFVPPLIALTRDCASFDAGHSADVSLTQKGEIVSADLVPSVAARSRPATRPGRPAHLR